MPFPILRGISNTLFRSEKLAVRNILRFEKVSLVLDLARIRVATKLKISMSFLIKGLSGSRSQGVRSANKAVVNHCNAASAVANEET